MTAAPARILVPSDGSENATRALAFAIEAAQATPGSSIELLNVQPGVPNAVSRFVPKADLADYHREEAMKALAPALDTLKRAGIAHDHHICVGDPGAMIAAFAKHLACSQVVMGTRGLGPTLGLLLGSVATETLRHTDVPVTLIK